MPSAPGCVSIPGLRWRPSAPGETKGMIVDEVGVPSERSFSQVLEEVRRVGADVARRADELDRLGGFPKDLFDDLSATGCFQALLPREFRGLELSFSEINELI